MKRCNMCGQDLPPSDFWVNNGNLDGRYTNCRECMKEYRNVRNRALTMETKRASRYRRKYGITLERYAEMHAEQNGRCAICDRTEPASGRRLSVDHCHKTGRVRGLLCTPCNTRLGSYELVLVDEKALAYLT